MDASFFWEVIGVNINPAKWRHFAGLGGYIRLFLVNFAGLVDFRTVG